jgi:hypothetical protein
MGHWIVIWSRARSCETTIWALVWPELQRTQAQTDSTYSSKVRKFLLGRSNNCFCSPFSGIGGLPDGRFQNCRLTLGSPQGSFRTCPQSSSTGPSGCASGGDLHSVLLSPPGSREVVLRISDLTSQHHFRSKSGRGQAAETTLVITKPKTLTAQPVRWNKTPAPVSMPKPL